MAPASAGAGAATGPSTTTAVNTDGSSSAPAQRRRTRSMSKDNDALLAQNSTGPSATSSSSRFRAPKARQCKNCGSEDIQNDEASGTAVCTHCGTVMEENLIVSSVEFSENAMGTSSVIGKFVSSTCTKPYGGGLGGPAHGYAKESREVTINNGRRSISQLAATLKLNQHFVDSAHRLFLLAIQRNFVQGRRAQNVVAACLYIVCRREKSPHLLIDFSDVLQTNVYVLGATFLKLVQLLNMTVPVIDPSLYIHRFAGKLEFEEKTHQVAMTALRLVKRMNRDWIITGRQPSGICGAALILAARMHGFRRSQDEVVQVLRICKATLRDRMREFVSTASGNLTMEEFQTIDLPGCADPPSFTRNRKEQMAIEAEKRGQITDGSAVSTTIVLSTNTSAASRQKKASSMYNKLQSDLEVALTSVENMQNTAGERKRNPGPVLPSKDDDGDSGLSELSDFEDDEFLLSKEEHEKKDKLWHKMNETFLKEQLERDSADPPKPRTRKKRKQEHGTGSQQTMDARGSNAAAGGEQAAENAKKTSKKVNYANIEAFLKE